MDADEFAKRVPRLYHMAEDGSLDGIRRHGLRSTTALLDLFEIDARLRSTIEFQWRPEKVEIAHPLHGSAVIRDQKPMRPTALARCLEDGLTPSDWYRMLNRRVFFWPSKVKVQTLLNARAYRSDIQLVLTVDTSGLVSDGRHALEASRINSGSTLYVPRPRGLGTFIPVASLPPRAPIAEVAADYSIPDIDSHLIGIERWRAATLVERLL